MNLNQTSNSHKSIQRLFKLPWSITFIFFMTSFIFLLIASKNSPIYEFNDWVDLNAFVTMGKSWGHGIIPYKDLFEQKGPALYFLFLIASKISNSYFGVFFLEVINMTLVSCILFKLGSLFLDANKSIAFVLLSYLLLTFDPFFKTGGSAEEFVFLPICYTIYLIFKFQQNNFKLLNYEYFLIGLSLSYLFWVKYTMIGASLGFLLSVGICLVAKKDTNQLIRGSVWVLFGFLSLSLFIISYFSLVGAWGDLVFNYFYANIKLYPSGTTSGLIGNIFNAILIFSRRVVSQHLLIVVFILGFLGMIVSNRLFKDKWTLFIYSSSYFMLVISTFYGGKGFNYYYLILMPFACLPILLVLTYMDKIKFTNLQVLFIGLVSFVTLFGTTNNFQFSKAFPDNRSLTFNPNDHSYAQEKFAKIINEEENPTMLNYGFLDGGFYQAANILPSIYYFERQNISQEHLPEMMDTQNQAVNDKAVMFIVHKGYYGQSEEESVPVNIRANYSLVSEHSQFNEIDLTYRLYRVNP